MSEWIEIHCTCGSLDEARRISRYLVQERYVANAKIIPWFESINMWNNQLDTTQESQIIMMTRRDLLDKVQEIIKQNSSYQIPEITFFPIEGGNRAFLEWAKESTLPTTSTKVEK